MVRAAVFVITVGYLLGLVYGLPAQAHHNPGGTLPGIPTPIILNVLDDGAVAWCVDYRASTYPNFVAQGHQTNDIATLATGIEHYQIPGYFNTIQAAKAAGCEEWHTMPDEPMNSGVAGTILYANWPVQVKYNWRLGYTDFKTTWGHEGTACGHAMGEHEGYDDIKFVSHFGTYGYWASPWNAPTVMDFGTGIWQCQPSDIANIHARMLPKALLTYGMFTEDDGRIYGYYCNADKNAGRRVAVMATAPWGEVFWTGNHMPVTDGCHKIEVISEPGWCFAFNVENGFNWKRPDLRNDRTFGCV